MITSKKCIYVGGLTETVDTNILRSIFAAFGDVVDLKMPIEILSGKHKGYAFIEFKDNEDAQDAIDNMHESEIYGKTIRVTSAKGRSMDGDLSTSTKAIWHSDAWLEQFAGKTLTETEANSENQEINAKTIVDFPVEKEIVFMDISIDGQYAGRLLFELHNDIVPKTAYNFRRLCQEKKGQGYKQCSFHRIIPGFMAQGGDFTHGNGKGGESIFGMKFEDENFKIQHLNAGDLSMANSGPNSNGSQFFITFTKTEHLDNKHVVFGRLKSGLDTLKKIEAVGTQRGRPKKRVNIEDCGQLL